LEKERQIVDVEFAKVMAEERKQALQQAKLLQYHETDKVKSFHVRLFYFCIIIKCLGSRFSNYTQYEREQRVGR